MNVQVGWWASSEALPEGRFVALGHEVLYLSLSDWSLEPVFIESEVVTLDRGR